MIFHTHVPSAPLSYFVEFFWYYDEYSPQHTKEKLLPDGSMELIIDLRDHPKHTYDRNDFSRATPYRKSWLSGMHNEYIVIESSPGSMMGAHFRPGGAWPFFKAPLSEFTDSVVELDCLIGPTASSLRDQLLAAPTHREKFQILETFLSARGGTRLYPDRTVHHALEQFLSAPMRLLIRDLATKVGVSQKHLIHLFDKRVGLKPKQLDRVIRFQRVLRTITEMKPREVDWAAIAVDCGYYDQAHFIRDFHAFSGMTPETYLKNNTWEYTNFVMVDPPNATLQ